jgi:hypothetical protein
VLIEERHSILRYLKNRFHVAGVRARSLDPLIGPR